ncbi:MAG: TolC family protein, partial [Deltaproteobacteria bacterium]|nr:TolC family protein [Deltaproteobacteria bacterium]
HTSDPVLLTYTEALARVLDNNLYLKTFSQELEVRLAEARQSGLYPNPEFSIEMENFAGSGDYSGTDNAETTVLFSQRFELGGKRQQRLAVGHLNIELAEREHALAKANLIAETTVRFVDVLAAQQSLELAKEQSSLAEKVLKTVNQRIAAGKTASIERLRFEALQAEAALRVSQAKLKLTTSRQALAALWNQVSVEFAGVEGTFERLPELPVWAELSAKVPFSPAFAAQQTEVSKADETLALEESRRIPDLTLSIGGKNFEDTNDNAFVAGLAISLPLFDRNQGAIDAARARQAKARLMAQATRLELQTQLEDVWQRLTVAHTEASLLRDQLLPAVQQSFEAISYGYQVGKFGYLEVLDAEQTLFETKSRYIDSLTRYHKTFAEMEQLLGQSVSPPDHRTTSTVSTTRGQS